jgi:hypothetical protein
MKRRRPHSSPRAAAAALHAHAPAAVPAADDLGICVHCHRDFVVPVQWEPVGEDRWWMYLRCAECGVSREVTVHESVADRYDEHLAAGQRVLSRAADRLHHDAIAAEIEDFAAALHHGLIQPADFAT